MRAVYFRAMKKDGPIFLLLDGLLIGIVCATLTLEAVLIFDLGGYGDGMRELSPFLLGALWVHLSAAIAPFGTLLLLVRDTD
jgi:hypothetical protein